MTIILMQEHTHTFDTRGKMTCGCTSKPATQVVSTSSCCETAATSQCQSQTPEQHTNSADSCCSSGCGSDPDEPDGSDTCSIANNDDGDGCCGCDSAPETLGWRFYLPVAGSLTLLFLGLFLEKGIQATFFSGWLKVLWYFVAYLPVGFPVLQSAWRSIKQGDFFTEFFLMSVATMGAFAIGEYPEGVAVMVFYSIGELLQSLAVQRAKTNIQTLLDVRPNIAHVQRDGGFASVTPDSVKIGEIIQVKVGEKIPLDGRLLSEKASLNTAALTGESKPQTLSKGKTVMAGSINLSGVIDIQVEKAFNDSTIARILDLVQNASARKSKTELLVRRLAKVYTPIVTYLSIAILLLPYFFVADYDFSTWLYRALIFLVISCPCALVISIPLGYFGGLGAASQNGLLFKGATFLDQITQIKIVVMDKTGTLTQGIFRIQQIVIANGMSETDFMQTLMAVEAKSTHPIAKAIMAYTDDKASLAADNQNVSVADVKEIAGQGLSATINGKNVLVGNQALLNAANITVPTAIHDIVESTVLMAIDGQFAGYVVIADELKTDAKAAITQLRAAGVEQLIMLSGDKNSITQQVAQTLNLDAAMGELLPEDKLHAVEELLQAQKNSGKKVAFVGDGINDAPVLAVSDVGMAMGGLGSDVAIETADVVIQTDQPTKIATAIRIGKSTQRIIWQNIALAFGVKGIVLLLGVFGMASLWQAVFADVGVALLAIGNAIRLQKMHWQ